MAAIAGGQWVVTKRYIEKSHKAGGWLSPAKFALPKEQVGKQQ